MFVREQAITIPDIPQIQASARAGSRGLLRRYTFPLFFTVSDDGKL